MKVFMRLLGTYMKETERYSLALITELGGGTGGKEGGMREGKKKTLDSMSLPRKTSRASMRKVQVTESRCGNWRPLSEGNHVKGYSAVTSHPRNMWFL